MATITEDYVSFEVAKLLKDKGFNEECFALYNPDGILIQSGIRLNNIQVGRVKGSYSAPTRQMAMKWLRENHHLWIDIDPLTNYKWTWSIWFMNDSNLKMGESSQVISTYEGACEVAIKYCLEHLI